MSVRFYYWLLFIFLLISLGLLALRAFDIWHQVWWVYYSAYIMAAIAHTWYIFLLLAKEDIWPRKYAPYKGGKIAVVMPCYNEDPDLVERAIQSVIAAEGNKEIFVIDDGSNNNIKKTYYKYVYSHGIKLHIFERNKGKREALYHGIKNLVRRADFVVTMDSDTVLDRYALVRLAEALQHENVGAASGDVRLLNEKENWLTRMTGAYYWSALNIQRRAQSALGMVACCSGALAGYRAGVIKAVMDDFVSQEFLGRACTYSEDRHLTNLTLREGYDVVFVPEAVAYTYSPVTYRQFWKQQLRWRRGFMQEAIFALTFMWRVKPTLFLEILFFELVLPFLAFGLMLMVLLNIILDPIFAVSVLLPSLVLLAVVRHLPMVFYAPGKLLALILFTFFSHFVMYWQTLLALFTVRKSKGWSTR